MFHTQPWKPNMHALRIYPVHKGRKALGQNKTVVTKVTIRRSSKKIKTVEKNALVVLVGWKCDRKTAHTGSLAIILTFTVYIWESDASEEA